MEGKSSSILLQVLGSLLKFMTVETSPWANPRVNIVSRMFFSCTCYLLDSPK